MALPPHARPLLQYFSCQVWLIRADRPRMLGSVVVLDDDSSPCLCGRHAYAPALESRGGSRCARTRASARRVHREMTTTTGLGLIKEEEDETSGSVEIDMCYIRVARSKERRFQARRARLPVTCSAGGRACPQNSGHAPKRHPCPIVSRSERQKQPSPPTPVVMQTATPQRQRQRQQQQQTRAAQQAHRAAAAAEQQKSSRSAASAQQQSGVVRPHSLTVKLGAGLMHLTRRKSILT
jgi:hypothetical protein